MKMDVVFLENNMTTPVKLSENNQTFSTDVGEVMVLHDGQNGATFIPSVSNDGVISWTNDRDLPNPEPVNIHGKDGYTPIKGKDYFDGEPGKDGSPGKDGADGQPGKDGMNGKDGADGYTPVKGTDYFTEADKAEMVSAVISALPVYDGKVVDV